GHVKSCVNLLRKGGADLLVLKLGKHLEQELSLLEQVSELFPATATIVIGNTDHPQLAALAWELGARHVLFPPEPVEKIAGILKGFLPEKERLPGSGKTD